MKIHIQGRDLDIQDLTQERIGELSFKLSDRQKDGQFMRFVKDTPMSPQQNQKVLETKLAEKNSIHKLIIEPTQQEIIGSVLFDMFDEEEKSLESYTRVSPKYNKLGIGSQCRKKIIAELLSGTDIQKIISWHSAWNTGSFIINKRAGFRLIDFAPNNTFLPNIGKTTDDFKREIGKGQRLQAHGEMLDMEQKNRERIMQGLHKHNLVHLLQIDT